MPNYDAFRPRIVRAGSGWVALVDDGGPCRGRHAAHATADVARTCLREILESIPRAVVEQRETTARRRVGREYLSR